MTNPETSIIIRTFNEERYLPDLLEGIKGQRYQDFEVVNVDSGSYDRTTEIAQGYGARLLSINSQDFTFGYSLNVGIEAALGQFMVIVSAHTKPVDEFWLGRLIEPLRQDGTAMTYGRQIGVESSKFGETRDLERTFGLEPQVLKPPRFFANNANAAMHKRLWHEHPFDPDLSGQEDIEWAKFWMEQGYQIVYEPTAAIYHIHQESWRQVRRRYYREALATRNIGVWRRREAVPLALREVGYLVSDLAHALTQGQLLAVAREIVNFRINKGYGTVSGLLDGKAMATQGGRESLFFDRRCAAVAIHGPNHASLDEIDVPAVQPGDVLIRVAYAGVCSTDLGRLSGDRNFFGGNDPKYPLVPGQELSGWVARIGANVTHLEEGNAVAVRPIQGCGACEPCRSSNPQACQKYEAEGAGAITGAYAEYLSVPGSLVHKLPQGADMKEAVLCDALAVALKGLRKLGRLLDGSMKPPKIAVVGAGPIGHLCAQVLARREYPVTVFDRNPNRLGCFDRTPISTGSDLDEIADYNVLIEATGDQGSLQQMLQKSSPSAALLLLGLPYSHRQFTIQGGLESDKTIIWSIGAESEDFREAVHLLPDLPMSSLTECVVPMPQFNEAWDLFRQGDHLKVLLEVA